MSERTITDFGEGACTCVRCPGCDLCRNGGSHWTINGCPIHVHGTLLNPLASPPVSVT